MEALLKKLQEEAGITEEQAMKAIAIIKEQIEDGDFKINWDRLMKNKYEDLLFKAKGKFDNASGEATKFADSLTGKADELADNAREKLRDISQKAADFFDDKNKKS